MTKRREELLQTWHAVPLSALLLLFVATMYRRVLFVLLVCVCVRAVFEWVSLWAALFRFGVARCIFSVHILVLFESLRCVDAARTQNACSIFNVKRISCFRFFSSFWWYSENIVFVLLSFAFFGARSIYSIILKTILVNYILLRKQKSVYDSARLLLYLILKRERETAKKNRFKNHH